MIRSIAAVFLLATPVFAQEGPSVGGACAVLDAGGAVNTYAPCQKSAEICTGSRCEHVFTWPSGARTVLESPGPDVAGATRINGSAVLPPVAEAATATRTCVRNSSSGLTFCWEPGAGAQTAAAGGPSAFTRGDATATTDVAQVTVLTEATDVAARADTMPLIEAFQGLYRAAPNWSCKSEEVGSDGGAIAVVGNQLLGVETFCALSSPRAVGSTGAVQVMAQCSGEGERYEQEMVLFRDGKALLVLRDSGALRLDACPS